jgi:RNA polymerase sigma factor (sigma-70 family)
MDVGSGSLSRPVRPAASHAVAVMRYEEIYETHRPRILRICRLVLSDADEAEDVVQEVFVKSMREWESGGREIAWGPWLARVAVNTCRDRRRSGWWRFWRADAAEFAEGEFAHGDPTPEDRAVGDDLRRVIWRAFQQLTVRQREVFALRHLEGYSTEETAGILGIATGSVKTHLFRAAHALRASLGGAP